MQQKQTQNWVSNTITKLEAIMKDDGIQSVPDIQTKDQKIENKNSSVSEYNFMHVIVFHGIPLTSLSVRKSKNLNV